MYQRKSTQVLSAKIISSTSPFPLQLSPRYDVKAFLVFFTVMSSRELMLLIFISLDGQLAPSSGQIVELHHLMGDFSDTDWVCGQVGLVLTSLWLWSYELWRRLQIKCTWTPGLTRANEQLLLSQCFLDTWRRKVSVNWPEETSAGENLTRGIWKWLMNRITLIQSVWLDRRNVSFWVVLQIFRDRLWFKWVSIWVKGDGLRMISMYNCW